MPRPCVSQTGDGPFVEIRLGGFAGADAAAKQCHQGAEGAGQRPGGSDASEGRGGSRAVPTSLVGHEASGIQQLSSAGGGGDAGGPSGAGERSEMSAARPSWMNAITGIFEVRTHLKLTTAYRTVAQLISLPAASVLGQKMMLATQPERHF